MGDKSFLKSSIEAFPGFNEYKIGVYLKGSGEYLKRVHHNETKGELKTWLVNHYAQSIERNERLVRERNIVFDNGPSLFDEDFNTWEWITGTTPPPTSGVYMIMDDCKIMYIGMSKNLKQRLLSHPHVNTLKRLGFNVKLFYFRTDNPTLVEKYLISKLSPPLNEQYL